MSDIKEQKEEEITLSLWEVFQGVFAMFIGVQSEEKRERQFKYGKLHQFIIVGAVVTVLSILHIVLLVKLVLKWAGVE
ncbi:MAG: DUF2970 domain-containing protein [Gammaproteobacteria bacterium]